MTEGFYSTDASDLGMGGFFEGRHFSVAWDALKEAGPRDIPAASLRYNKSKLWPSRDNPALWAIHYRELFGVWWSLLVWTEPCNLAGTTVTIHCDNSVASWDIRNCTSPNMMMMMLLRAIFQFCARYNIRLNILDITSKANILADALSRLDWAAYHAALAVWEKQREAEGPFRPTYTTRTFRDPGLLEHEATAVLDRLAGVPEGGAGNKLQ